MRSGLVYEFALGHPEKGWWPIRWPFASGSAWETVAQVFGERRAEIVRDALSAEANERV
jgi:hypothetical protein